MSRNPKYVVWNNLLHNFSMYVIFKITRENKLVINSKYLNFNYKELFSTTIVFSRNI